MTTRRLGLLSLGGVVHLVAVAHPFRGWGAMWALVLLAAGVGCQGTWPAGSMTQGRSERAAHSKPDIEQAEPEPEPKILPETYLAAGKLAESRGDMALALSMYRKATALNHEYVEAYNRLGLALEALGETQSAQEAFARAVELAPDRAYLRNNLAFVHMHRKNWAEAEAQLEKALELQPDFARARVNLAMVLAHTGRYEQAMDQFLRVLPPPSAHYNMGLIHQAEHRYELARVSFAQALAMNPQMTPAQEALQRLESASARTRRTSVAPDGVVRANRRVSLDDLLDAEPASAVLNHSPEAIPTTNPSDLPMQITPPMKGGERVDKAPSPGMTLPPSTRPAGQPVSSADLQGGLTVAANTPLTVDPPIIEMLHSAGSALGSRSVDEVPPLVRPDVIGTTAAPARTPQRATDK